MGSNTYTVTINLDQETMDRLNGISPQGQPWSLVGFKSVQCSAGGQPVVWFSKTGTFMPSIELEWEEDDYAYISADQLIAGGDIGTAFPPYAITPNQTAKYDGSTFNVISSGYPPSDPNAQNIIVYNNTSLPNLVCGLAKMQPAQVSTSSTPVPICAFPIDGGNEVVMLPRVQILLMFTSQQVNTSVVAERAYGPGLFITLTGHAGDAKTFNVSYNKDKDWDFGGEAWATEVAPNQALAPILNPDAASLKLARAA